MFSNEHYESLSSTPKFLDAMVPNQSRAMAINYGEDEDQVLTWIIMCLAHGINKLYFRRKIIIDKGVIKNEDYFKRPSATNSPAGLPFRPKMRHMLYIGGKYLQKYETFEDNKMVFLQLTNCRAKSLLDEILLSTQKDIPTIERIPYDPIDNLVDEMNRKWHSSYRYNIEVGRGYCLYPKENESFNSMLTQALGIQIIETVGDGNCMLDSIKKCLKKIMPIDFKLMSFTAMRRVVCLYLREKEKQGDLASSSIFLEKKTVAEEISHIHSIQEDNLYTYLNIWAATALAIHYDINIMIYQVNLTVEEVAKREAAAQNKKVGKERQKKKEAPDLFDARIFGGGEVPTYHCHLSNEVNERGFDPRKPTAYILYDHVRRHYQATEEPALTKEDEQSWAERAASFSLGEAL
jgi:hypothetical protein